MESEEGGVLALCWLGVPGPATAGRPLPGTPRTDAGGKQKNVLSRPTAYT